MLDAAIIERFGTLGILFIAIAYSGRWLAIKVVEPLVASHTGLVEQLKHSDSRQIDTLEKQAETLDRIVETQREICQIIKSAAKNN